MAASAALLVLLGLSIYGPLTTGDDNKEPAAASTPSATTTAGGARPTKVFENCDDAEAEFKRLYEQLLQRGSEGDVAGMKAWAETQLQTSNIQ